MLTPHPRSWSLCTLAFASSICACAADQSHVERSPDEVTSSSRPPAEPADDGGPTEDDLETDLVSAQAASSDAAVQDTGEDGGTELLESLTAEVAREVNRSLKRGDVTALAPRIPSASKITITQYQGDCGSTGREPECTTRRALGGFGEFERWLAEMHRGWTPRNCRPAASEAQQRLCRWPNGLDIRGVMGCDDRCCRFRRDELHENALYLLSMCFTPDRTLQIESITFSEE